ncbi:unnamed protein product [Caenorhabditis bovis]|uniref:SHSP domain-containing protein n=1 Tax=Caenorhabditis bovis TaxID=2654633 RepID=A0A8S1FG76_9PELO|nr:unnamed protein product [Caenorhabditis bovis]
MLVLRTPFDSLFEDFDRITVPYWRNADHSCFNFSNPIGEIVNNDQKFGMQIDVSHFKPENLKVNINGNELTVEGEQEVKHEHGYSKRSFHRMVRLPDDVDPSAMTSSLSNDGHLTLSAPKKRAIENKSRPIPINFKKSK